MGESIMFTNQYFRVCAIFFIMALLAYAIWQSSHPVSVIPSETFTANHQMPSKNSSIKKIAPEKIPAPAKKLQQLVNEPEKKPSDAQLLHQKIQQLDKRLLRIDEQLSTQGFSAPSDVLEPQKNTANSEINIRLQTIKNHINDAKNNNNI